MISLHLQITAIIISCALTGLIIRAVRNDWIQLKFSLLWIFISLSTLLFSIFPTLAFLLASALGITTPVNALFFISIIMILLVIFQLTAILSQTEEKQRHLAQRLAILETELNLHKDYLKQPKKGG